MSDIKREELVRILADRIRFATEAAEMAHARTGANAEADESHFTGHVLALWGVAREVGVYEDVNDELYHREGGPE